MLGNERVMGSNGRATGWDELVIAGWGGNFPRRRLAREISREVDGRMIGQTHAASMALADVADGRESGRHRVVSRMARGIGRGVGTVDRGGVGGGEGPCRVFASV
jgi:hypothetical protein